MMDRACSILDNRGNTRLKANPSLMPNSQGQLRITIPIRL
jgi:hypothetical protein